MLFLMSDEDHYTSSGSDWCIKYSSINVKLAEKCDK